jgi:2-oxoglutarate ferredoxin oxidoreductase subunit delta
MAVEVTIDEYYCKGCGLCIDACPKKALELAEHLNAAGYHPAVCIALDECTACGLCYVACPDSAITISK